MKKSLYSLILTEDVITAIDEMANRFNTSRSSYINELLAKHVLYTTAKQVVTVLLNETKDMLTSYEKYTFTEMNSDSHMTVRSALKYSYNPTVKYCIQVIKRDGGFVGKMRVSVKTQNADLLNEMKEFFTYWNSLENGYENGKNSGGKGDYGFDDASYLKSFEYGKYDRLTDLSFLARRTAFYINSMDEAFNLFISDDYIKHEKESKIKKIADIYNQYINMTGEVT